MELLDRERGGNLAVAETVSIGTLSSLPSPPTFMSSTLELHARSMPIHLIHHTSKIKSRYIGFRGDVNTAFWPYPSHQAVLTIIIKLRIQMPISSFVSWGQLLWTTHHGTCVRTHSFMAPHGSSMWRNTSTIELSIAVSIAGGLHMVTS